jgi:hypothetical protein
VVSVFVGVTATIAPPLATADKGQYDEFYTPPNPLPDVKAGAVIRSEPSRIVLKPSGQLGAFMASGTRIMYRSTGATGEPIAVLRAHKPVAG